MTYSFTKKVNSLVLTEEVQESQGIEKNLVYINTAGDNVDIVFEAELTNSEFIILTGIVNNHVARALGRYMYEKTVTASKLKSEIITSGIKTKLKSCVYENDNQITVVFIEELSREDKLKLDEIVDLHKHDLTSVPVAITGEQRDPDGLLKQASSFVDTGYRVVREMYKFSALTPGSTFLDIPIAPDTKLSGGEYWITEATTMNVDEEDILEFSLVDKDGVLIEPRSGMPYFAILGMTPGTDVLELFKFIRNEYVLKGSKEGGYRSSFLPPAVTADDLVEGLYLRCKYESYGGNPVKILVRLFYYER
jgi:hypothetical protein